MLFNLVLIAMLAFSFGFYNPTIVYYLRTWLRSLIKKG